MSAVHLFQGDSLAVAPHLENYICLKVLHYPVLEELLPNAFAVSAKFQLIG